MGLYIKGLRLPKKGRYTSFTVYSDGRVVYKFGRDHAGQAIEVPAHGRLIDESTALNARYENMNWVYDVHDLEPFLSEIPTVIPAEEDT